MTAIRLTAISGLVAVALIASACQRHHARHGGIYIGPAPLSAEERQARREERQARRAQFCIENPDHRRCGSDGAPRGRDRDRNRDSEGS